MATKSRTRNAARRAGFLFVAFALVVVAVTVAWGVMLATASITSRPAAFIAAGIGTYALLLGAGGWLLTRRVPQTRRRRARTIAATVGAAVLLVPSAYWAVRPAPTARAELVPGVLHWPLSDGSRLAALRIPARGSAGAEPIVFLHGGPGVADMAHDAPVFGQLAATGRDVWLYDQIGSGQSSRLTDPRGYSLDRDLADLEEVRRRINADRIVLIGHSYGSTLAANYLARYPEHVAMVVFSSPGRMVPRVGDTAGTGMLGRLPLGQRMRAYAAVLHPRSMVTFTLTKVSPRAARAFAGDAEMDARFEELYRLTSPGLVCGSSAAPPTPRAPGFYANQVPLNRTRPAEDIRPVLRGVRVPSLVLKGGCDYLPWSLAQEYRDVLPDSRLVYFDDTGHQIYAEREQRYLAVVSAFLSGSTLPVRAWTGDGPPPTYRGQPG